MRKPFSIPVNSNDMVRICIGIVDISKYVGGRCDGSAKAVTDPEYAV